MKRLVVAALMVAILLALACTGKPGKACEADVLLDQAQLCPDRASLGFGLEFRTGTFIGSAPVDAISIKNGGVADLNISSVTITGDTAFTYSPSWQVVSVQGAGSLPSTTVTGNKAVFVQVEFKPTQARAYSGAITVVSNAENTPSVTFAISGCGVPADGGSSPCYRDGG
jgi:hypothetical protein